MLKLNRTAVGLTRASTPYFRAASKNVDGRVKPGHNEEQAYAALLRPTRRLRGGGRRGPLRLRRRRARIAAAEDDAARVAVEIVHGAADVGERAAAVGHQRAGALVKILGEILDRLHHGRELAAGGAAADRVQAE